MSDVRVTKLVVVGKNVQVDVSEESSTGLWTARCEHGLPVLDPLRGRALVVWCANREDAQDVAADMIEAFDPLVDRMSSIAQDTSAWVSQFYNRSTPVARGDLLAADPEDTAE